MLAEDGVVDDGVDGAVDGGDVGVEDDGVDGLVDGDVGVEFDGDGWRCA